MAYISHIKAAPYPVKEVNFHTQNRGSRVVQMLFFHLSVPSYKGSNSSFFELTPG